MPYFIQRHKEKEDSLRDIFQTHKKEATHLIQMLEAQKFKFNKMLDHMSLTDDTKPDQKTRQVKQGLIHSIFNFFFGSGDSNSETINQIKDNLDILEQKPTSPWK